MQLYDYNPKKEAFLSLILELYPTDEQKQKIHDYIIATNFVYDYIIKLMDDKYIDYINDESHSKFLSRFDCNKAVVELQKDSKELQNIPQHILTQVFVRAITGYKMYLENLANHPIQHFPNNITNSFSIDLGNSFYIKDNYITLPGFADKSSVGLRVGKIKCQNRGIDSTKINLYNGSIYIDNFGRYYFYATYKVFRQQFNYNKTKCIGIDLGYRLDGSNTIVCSDGTRYNLPDIKHLEARTKYFQSEYEKIVSNRIAKFGENSVDHISNKEKEMLNKFRIAHRKIYDTLDTFYNQSTIDIIKKNPEAIVIEDKFAEDLKIKSKYNLINYGYTSCGKIGEMIIYKALLHYIPIYVADRNFKSSYICSSCFHVNTKDLKQKQIFRCEFCGKIIDRDLNASINLENIYNFRHSFLNYNMFIKDIIM